VTLRSAGLLIRVWSVWPPRSGPAPGRRGQPRQGGSGPWHPRHQHHGVHLGPQHRHRRPARHGGPGRGHGLHDRSFDLHTRIPPTSATPSASLARPPGPWDRGGRRVNHGRAAHGHDRCRQVTARRRSASLRWAPPCGRRRGRCPLSNGSPSLNARRSTTRSNGPDGHQQRSYSLWGRRSAGTEGVAGRVMAAIVFLVLLAGHLLGDLVV
jgi:hypothetical protein